MDIRLAIPEDLDGIDDVFSENKEFVGFVMRVSIEEAIYKKRVSVAEMDNKIVGAVNFAPTKKGYITIYEIAATVKGKGVGKSLILSLLNYGMDIKLKVTEDNESGKAFYEKVGFKHIGTERGKKRRLFVMYYKNKKQKRLF